MTKYKLLAIDLDGTLLSKLKQVSKANLEALKQYINNGGTPVITTGRSIVSVSKIVNRIDRFCKGKSEYAICFNGAYIKNFHTGEVVEKKIPDPTVREIKEYVIKNKLVLWAYTKESTELKGVYVTKTFANLIVRLGKGVNLLKLTDDISDLSAYKLNILSFSHKKISKVWEELHEKFGDKLNFSYSHPKLIEINLGGVNKGTSIDYVANRIKATKDQIAAIGDSNNDLAAFKSATLKIAVKSKSKKLIEAATFYLPYSRNAVADAIHKYVLSNDQASVALVASDLDGTLLANGSKTIDVETKHCIEKIVNELDKKFVICTGRNVDDILLVADYFDIKKRENLFAIGVNGSFVYDIVHNKYIYKKLMPAEMVKQILDKFEKFLLDKNLKGQISYEMFVAYDEKSIASGELHTHYVQNIDYFKNSYIEHDPGVLSHFWAKRNIKEINKDMPHDKTMKFLFMFESLEDRARAIALFNVFKNDVEISSSGSRNIEIMALHVTKGNALTRLCDYLSIDVKNTLPVGDELNDISMLSISPNSVTLKSSKQEVQQAAGYVLDQPTSVVVGKAIEMLVLNK